MKLNELPQEIQDKLIADREEWKGTITNGSYNVAAFNKQGTRYFSAIRRCVGWQDTNTGNSMPFGGGTYWIVKYGEMRWVHRKLRNPLGEIEHVYEWVTGPRYGSVTMSNGESIEIPGQLATKKEVMALLKKLEFKGFTDLRSN